MDELDTICRTMLDNAEMNIEVTLYPFSVRLIFYVVGTDQKVIFNCLEIVSLHLDKDPQDNPLFTVLETNVIPPKKIRPTPLSDFGFGLLDQTEYCWQIDLQPQVILQIKALTFHWQVQTITADELKWLDG